MSEITPHTVQSPKSYFLKNADFLGEFRVDNIYIYNI